MPTRWKRRLIRKLEPTQVGITISMRTNDQGLSSGWLAGWAWTLGLTVLCATLSFLFLNSFAHPNPALATWSGAFRAVINLPLAITVFSLFAVAVVIVPVTACYVLIRLASHRLSTKWYSRLAFGMLIGAVLNAGLSLSQGSGNWHREEFHENLVLNLYFPYSEIQVTTVLVALLSRKQWFGIA